MSNQQPTSLSPPRNCYFTIEGNIGCGKSTLLSVLKQRMGYIQWIQEPVSEWQNLGGKNINILEKYYKQPQRWGFTFQIYAIFTRIKVLNQAFLRFPDKVKFTQRSILADKYIFSQLMKDLGYMNQAEYQIFKGMYNNFEQMTNIKDLKIVYLRCNPEKCHERTKKRKRKQQDEIPLQYLKLIHQKHEQWMSQGDEKKILIIDTTQDFKDDENKIKEIIEKIDKFISIE